MCARESTIMAPEKLERAEILQGKVGLRAYLGVAEASSWAKKEGFLNYNHQHHAKIHQPAQDAKFSSTQRKTHICSTSAPPSCMKATPPTTSPHSRAKIGSLSPL